MNNDARPRCLRRDQEFRGGDVLLGADINQRCTFVPRGCFVNTLYNSYGVIGSKRRNLDRSNEMTAFEVGLWRVEAMRIVD